MRKRRLFNTAFLKMQKMCVNVRGLDKMHNFQLSKNYIYCGKNCRPANLKLMTKKVVNAKRKNDDIQLEILEN